MKHTKRRGAFKTFVVNGRALFGYVAVLVAVAVFAAAAYVSIPRWTDMIGSISENESARVMIENIIPAIGSEKTKTLSQNVINFFLGFDITEPSSIIKSRVSAFNAVEEAEVHTAPSQKNADQGEVTAQNSDGERYPIVETSSVVGGVSNSGANKDIYLNNETNIDIDINALLQEELSIEKSDGPLVLIVHTHTTESYTPSGQNDYTPEESTRTQDKNFNVVRVGNVIEEELKAAGIDVIHDETINDYPSYNGSYKKTLGIIEGYLQKYPSIQVVLDVHRDGMTKKDGTKLKVCADIDGEKAAQVMVLCGSSEGGLSHPNWRENLKLGLKIQDAMTKKYKGLARPLHFVKERYNQHATKGSMILEVGTDGNTLEEAMAGAKYGARSIAEVLKNYI